MSTSDPFDRISGYYNKLISKWGHDPRSCDYGRPESQITKFKVLSEVLDLNNLYILDVGCGFADYADYLYLTYECINYAGIDITPSMIDEARRLHPDMNLRVQNILTLEGYENFDVVTANGIFYLLEERAPDLMQEIIKKMFSLCRVGVAFNSLSSWAEDQVLGEFYADPLETLDFCHKLTSRVALRHDYHPRDFTIYMYKD